jgi:hypothetical protein
VPPMLLQWLRYHWLKYASVRAPEFSKQSLAFLHGSGALVGRTTVVT